MLLSNVDQVVTIVIFANEVDHTILGQVVETLSLALLNSIENGCLSLVVHEVGVTTCFN